MWYFFLLMQLQGSLFYVQYKGIKNFQYFIFYLMYNLSFEKAIKKMFKLIGKKLLKSVDIIFKNSNLKVYQLKWYWFVLLFSMCSILKIFFIIYLWVFISIDLHDKVKRFIFGWYLLLILNFFFMLDLLFESFNLFIFI